MKWGEILIDKLEKRTVRIRWAAVPVGFLAYIGFRHGLDAGMSVSIFVTLMCMVVLWVSYLHAYGVLSSQARLSALKSMDNKKEAYSFVYGGIVSEIQIVLVCVLLVGLWIVIW